MGNNGNNGKTPFQEIQSDAIQSRINNILSQDRPNSPFESDNSTPGGLLTNFQKSVTEDKDILQELKQCDWFSYEQIDKTNAAIDELKLVGLSLEPVLYRVVSYSAGLNGKRTELLCHSYSHITYDAQSDNGQNNNRRGMLSRIINRDPMQ